MLLITFNNKIFVIINIIYVILIINLKVIFLLNNNILFISLNG